MADKSMRSAWDEFWQGYLEHRSAAHKMVSDGECDGSGRTPRCGACPHSVYCTEWRHLSMPL